MKTDLPVPFYAIWFLDVWASCCVGKNQQGLMNSSSTTWGLKCKPRDLYGGLVSGSLWPIMFRPGVLGSNLLKSQPKRKILIGHHASKIILDLYASIYRIWRGDLDYLTLDRVATPES